MWLPVSELDLSKLQPSDANSFQGQLCGINLIGFIVKPECKAVLLDVKLPGMTDIEQSAALSRNAPACR